MSKRFRRYVRCTVSLTILFCPLFPVSVSHRIPAQEIAEERPPVMLLSLAFSRHGRWLVADGDLLRVYDLDSGLLKRTFTFPGRLVRMTVFSPTEENVFAAFSRQVASDSAKWRY